MYFVYQYNTSLFISMFCENKNRPQLHCDGKCKLAKMLQEKEKEEAAQILKQVQMEGIYFTPLKYTDLSLQKICLLKKVKYMPFILYPYSFLYTQRCDKPPEYFS